MVTTHLLPTWLRLIKPLLRPGMIDAEKGAGSTLRLALDEGLDGVNGQYFDEHGQPATASALARDEALQEALWAVSERWVAR